MNIPMLSFSLCASLFLCMCAEAPTDRPQARTLSKSSVQSFKGYKIRRFKLAQHAYVLPFRCFFAAKPREQARQRINTADFRQDKASRLETRNIDTTPFTP